MWQADPVTLTFTFVSRGAERLLGFPAERWYEPGFWASRILDEDRTTAVELCRRATHQGCDHEFEYRMVAADGSLRWVRDIVRVKLAADGSVDRLRGVIVDRTHAHQVDEALRRSERRFRAVFESSSSGIVLVALNGEITAANAAAARMLGYAPQDAIGRNVLEYADPDARAKMVGVLAHAVTHREGAVAFEQRFRHRLGHVVTALVSGVVIMDADLAEPHMIVQLHDISERKALQERLHQTQKLEAVGRLAGGIAHDFNNLLLIVRSYASLLEAGLHAGDPRRDDVAEICHAVDAGADLTRQLLAFSRQQVIEPRTIGLESLVTNLDRLIRTLVRENITVRTRFTGESSTIRIDPGQLEQVVLNLAANARDAMPAGGILTISVDQTTHDDVERDAMGVAAAIPEGAYVRLTVEDTGEGMDAETRARIFEPFFTTKAVGKGTGLGLATAYGVVKQNGGYIFVRSVLGEGTTFSLYFPHYDASAEDPAPRASGATDAHGHETILLVEDSRPVRAATRRTLEQLGYVVLEAESSPAAVAMCEAHDGPIDVLLTDIVMPGLSGVELARAIREKRPSIRILFMSGYADDAFGGGRAPSAGTMFIAKPFAPATLASKVREALSAQPEASGA